MGHEREMRVLKLAVARDNRGRGRNGRFASPARLALPGEASFDLGTYESKLLLQSLLPPPSATVVFFVVCRERQACIDFWKGKEASDISRPNMT